MCCAKKGGFRLAIKIFIDQGHNPRNPNSGAEGNGLYEQDITYEIGVLTAELIGSNPAFEVKLSRTSPEQVLGGSNTESLQQRVNAANSWGADYFISLHTNASSVSDTASWNEGYAYSVDSRGYDLGENILEQLIASTGLGSHGMFERPGLYVLRRTQMPSVLIELGFITTPYDAELMRDSPELFAEGVYNGILAYLGQL